MRLLSSLLCIFLISAGTQTSRAETDMSRRVLVVMNSAAQTQIENQQKYRFLQTVLNYYGLLPEYLELSQRKLPDDVKMNAYRGVISWLNSYKPKHLEEYLGWLNHQLDTHRAVVILGHLGEDYTLADRKRTIVLINTVYKRLGLRYKGLETQDIKQIEYVKKHARFVEFERTYPEIIRHYTCYQPLDSTLNSHLTVNRKDIPSSESVMIATGPNGGFARQEFIYWNDPVQQKSQWYINPFLFLKEALRLSTVPIPDPTTVNGNRAAFLHIDGEGFTAPSKIGRQQNCGHVIFKNILQKYHYPFSVSVSGRDVEADTKSAQQAKRIFSLPHVEPASYTYTQPIRWQSDKIRTEDEIDRSISIINAVLPPNRTCRLLFWTGDCLPQAAHIRRCDQLGILNINGGESRMDTYYNSYTSVNPLYRKVANTYQVFEGQISDKALNDSPTNMSYGYSLAIDSMKHTGAPIRIKPVNMHVSFLSGKNYAALNVINRVFGWIEKQAVTFMYTSEYIQMVHGFLNVNVTRIDKNTFNITDYGACATMRLDDCKKIPDLSRSQNVIGYQRIPDGLYVFLLPDQKQARLILMPADSAFKQPHIHSSNGRITEFQATPKTVRLVFAGHIPGNVDIGGLQPQQLFNVKGSAIGDSTQAITSDAAGMLAIKHLTKGTLEVEQL